MNDQVSQEPMKLPPLREVISEYHKPCPTVRKIQPPNLNGVDTRLPSLRGMEFSPAGPANTVPLAIPDISSKIPSELQSEIFNRILPKPGLPSSPYLSTLHRLPRRDHTNTYPVGVGSSPDRSNTKENSLQHPPEQQPILPQGTPPDALEMPSPLSPRSGSAKSGHQTEQEGRNSSINDQNIQTSDNVISSSPLKQTLVTKFEDISAHTAKCDTCNQRNSTGMTRCVSCGWQLCQGCRQKRGGDLSHKTFSAEHIEARSHSVPTSDAETVIASPSGNPTRKSGSQSPEENAARILIEMNADDSLLGVETTSSTSIPMQTRSGTLTPTPSNSTGSLQFSSNPVNGTDETEPVTSVDIVTASLSDESHLWGSVRRNPFRSARPHRPAFTQYSG